MIVNYFNKYTNQFEQCSEIHAEHLLMIYTGMDIIQLNIYHNIYTTIDGYLIAKVLDHIWFNNGDNMYMFMNADEWLSQQHIYLPFDNKAAQLKAIRSCVNNISYITNPININLIIMSKEYLSYGSIHEYINAVVQSTEEVIYRISSDLEITVNSLNNSYTNTDNWLLHNKQIYRCKNG